MRSFRAARFGVLPLAVLAFAMGAGAQIYPYDVAWTLNKPMGIALDGAYNAYIADFGNNRVGRVTSNNHTTTLYAGNGQALSSGDGVPASLPALNGPVD